MNVFFKFKITNEFPSHSNKIMDTKVAVFVKKTDN